jgi:16S rRNA (guanine966-N2)-methyltransferase
MRIISGKYRKKTINPPRNFRARPTTDMAKESLFNIIENNADIEPLKVLDLFSGTGSITYEFASRGCSDITCVELNHVHFSFIKKTIFDLGFEKEVKVMRSDVFKYLNYCNEKFDLIFADPPYSLPNLATIPGIILSKKLLKQDGMLIVEHSVANQFEKEPGFYQHKNYGAVNFSFFKLNS